MRPVMNVLDEMQFVTDETKSLFIEVCPICKHITYISDNLKELCCINELCYENLAYRLEFLYKSFKIPNFGYRTCFDLVQYYNMKHHMEIFKHVRKPEDIPYQSEYMQQKLYNLMYPIYNPTVAEFMSVFGIKHLQTRAKDLFYGYDSIEEFYSEFNYSEDFIREKLNISKNSIITSSVCYELSMYERFIRDISKYVTFRQTKFIKITENGEKVKVSLPRVKICITNSITYIPEDNKPFTNRDMFIKYLQTRYLDRYNIEEQSNVSTKTTYLVYDGGAKHSKYKSASNNNVTKILSSTELIQELDGGI